MPIINSFQAGSDDSLSSTSNNSVKNKVVTGELKLGDRYTTPTVAYSSSKYIFSLSYAISAYETGKIVRIKGTTYSSVTSFTNPYININNLGQKQIIGVIESGKYYDLIYNGTNFIVNSTNIGVNTSPIVITSSGTYTVNPNFIYHLILVGGGGGGLVYYDSYYSKYLGIGAGASGGMIKEIFKPDSTSITVTIGAAGENARITGTGSATNGGDTILGQFIAKGGGGGSSQAGNSSNYGNVDGGTGGSYEGGLGVNGTDGGIRAQMPSGFTGTVAAGAGYTYNGTKYGSGGSWNITDVCASPSVAETPQPGVAILIPL